MAGPMLYHGEPNGPSLAVLAVLAETGLDIPCRPIAMLRGERHAIPGLSAPLARDMGVEGEGPVLVIDGEAMTESVFIAQFLDETAGAGLQPDDAHARWQMLMWCRRITERCAPAAAFLGCKVHAAPELAAMDDAAFAELCDTIASEDLRMRWKDLRAGMFPEASLADSRAKVADAARLVDRQLADGRDWLMGPVTLADFETHAWLRGMVELEPAAFAGLDRTLAWLDRMAARPSVQAALARATRDRPDRFWAPGPEINRWG